MQYHLYFQMRSNIEWYLRWQHAYMISEFMIKCVWLLVARLRNWQTLRMIYRKERQKVKTQDNSFLIIFWCNKQEFKGLHYLRLTPNLFLAPIYIQIKNYDILKFDDNDKETISKYILMIVLLSKTFFVEKMYQTPEQGLEPWTVRLKA